MDRVNLCCPRNGKRNVVLIAVFNAVDRHRGAGFDVHAQGRVGISPLGEKPLAREGEAALSPARIPAR